MPIRAAVKVYRGDGQADGRYAVRCAPESADVGWIRRGGGYGDPEVLLHETFPELVGPEYTLRAVNYILGTHPVSSTSYVAGVGTVSKTKTYSNNRGDNSYIPGAVIPGYIVIKPDFPECIDDFGFLWFEDEAVVAGSASWVVAGNAADALTKEAR